MNTQFFYSWNRLLFKNYLSLTKPGIILGNLITTLGGFFMANQGLYGFFHHWQTQLIVLFFTVLGVSLVIASGCVLNNCFDKDIDKLMVRTANRVLVNNIISIRTAVLFGLLLAIIGITILYFLVNPLTAYLGVFGLFIYLFVYTILLKRYSIFSTEIGSLSGSTPIVMGYTAVTNQLDFGAWLLFIILCLWQIPHSFAIGIFRRNEYKAANIPLRSVVKGSQSSRKWMKFYTTIFCLPIILLYTQGFVGVFYLLMMILACGYWLFLTWLNIDTTSCLNRWAKRNFFVSIGVIFIFSLSIAVG